MNKTEKTQPRSYFYNYSYLKYKEAVNYWLNDYHQSIDYVIALQNIEMILIAIVSLRQERFNLILPEGNECSSQALFNSGRLGALSVRV